MKNIHQQIEPETLDRIRNRYESEGYRFVVRPRKPDVPRFLEGFEPDALALKGDGGLVIEVKASGKAATRSSVVEFLAREVPKHKGWKFELILADKEGVEPSPSLQPSRSEIVSRLAEVESLVKASNSQVALLYAWALLEAATRLTILRDQEDKRFLPRTVVEAIATNGFLSQDEEHRLSEIGKLRTWIVHGFTRVAVNEEQVRLLLEIVRRLVGQDEKSLARASRTRR